VTSARDIFVALACGRSGCPCATAATRAAGQTHCPAHDDEHPSLSISEHNGKVLVRCHAGCSQDTVVAALRERSLWEGAEPRSEVARRELTAYSYVGENGTPLYEVVRYEPKDFRQRRPDGRGGWIWNLEGVGRVLYNLPEVLATVAAARRQPHDTGWTVFITEGEKDADALNALGLVATTNTGGAGRWRDQYADVLRGGRAVIIADKDLNEDAEHPKGRAHADAVAGSLAGKVTSLKRIEMPGDHVKDLSDWLAAGGTKDTLLALVAAAPESMPVQPDGARLVTFSSVVAQSVIYLDAERMIPVRAVTVLAGPPGLGKSQWTVRLAAKNPGVTIIATAEDAADAVVRPRLEAAGADLARVHSIVMRREGLDGDIDLPDDVAELDRLVKQSGATLVVVDPLMAHLPDRINSWRDQSVRRALAPLQRLAEENGCAVVVVVHLNKGASDDPIQRVGGSIGITGAARSVLLLARDPDDPDSDAGLRRVLAHIKSNYGPYRPSLALRIEPFLLDPDGQHIETSRIVVTGESPHFGRDLLAQPDREEQKNERAMQFLIEELSQGRLLRTRLVEKAEAQGISLRTLERAKSQLGATVKAFRIGEAGRRGGGAWWWELRDDSDAGVINTADAVVEVAFPHLNDAAALIVEDEAALPDEPAIITAEPDISPSAALIAEVAELPEDVRGWFESTLGFAVATGIEPAKAWHVGVVNVLDRFAKDTGASETTQ